MNPGLFKYGLFQGTFCLFFFFEMGKRGPPVGVGYNNFKIKPLLAKQRVRKRIFEFQLPKSWIDRPGLLARLTTAMSRISTTCYYEKDGTRRERPIEVGQAYDYDPRAEWKVEYPPGFCFEEATLSAIQKSRVLRFFLYYRNPTDAELVERRFKYHKAKALAWWRRRKDVIMEEFDDDDYSKNDSDSSDQ